MPLFAGMYKQRYILVVIVLALCTPFCADLQINKYLGPLHGLAPCTRVKEGAVGYRHPGVTGRPRCPGGAGSGLNPLGPFKTPPHSGAAGGDLTARTAHAPSGGWCCPAEGGDLGARTAHARGAAPGAGGVAREARSNGGHPGAVVFAGLPRRERAVPEQAGDLPGGLAAAPHLR